MCAREPSISALSRLCSRSATSTFTCRHAHLRSRAVDFGIEARVFEKRDINVHATEAPTPKDGASGGVALVTAAVSVMAGISVRREVDMTGVITLRGRVLPIGGLK